VQKQAPSAGKLALMALFTLSCFGILLFLWITFGGSTPLKPRLYQVNADFPQATTLAQQADVRIAGVPIGKVTAKSKHGDRTRTVLSIDPPYAPLRSDVHAILRQKSLLGETYVELTPGTKTAPALKDGGTIADANVAPTVQLDQIFRAFDPPTRKAFMEWFDQQGRAVSNRGADINAALGNLEPFVNDATDILTVLNQQKAETSRLVSNTGVVFDALTQRDGQLTDLIRQSNRVFQTTAQRNEALRQIFIAFPTFLDQSRLTTVRLTRFAKETNPLITQLRPAARQLSPTLKDLHGLAPSLKNLFKNLGPLEDVSRAGLPATERLLDDTRPLLVQVDPFLRQVNPILQYLGLYKKEIAQFFANDVASTQATDRPAAASAPVHYLRTANPLNPENLAAYPHRIATNRSNPYTQPGLYSQYPLKVFGTYLCTNNAVPPLAPPGGGGPIPPVPQIPLPPGLPQPPPLPQPTEQPLPQQLRDLINQFAYTATGPVAPPCTGQEPLGHLVGQNQLYPHVLPAP
jgi:phospholipid/cholesterol/gamma-HCH transport system substrate-binding protein